MKDVFDTSATFADLKLGADLLRGIEALGFVHPTHVQAKLIPVALTGKDVLGQSRTGTGKTAAFGIPLIERTNDEDAFGSLVLCPTRELAIQIAHELRNLARFLPLRIVPIYGGQRMTAQIPKLEKGPHIIVGTPGRVMDFHQRGKLPYDKFRMVVLDEVDRMLDIGFRDDIRKILGQMRHEHQTLFVSATISPEIEKLANRYLKDAVKLELTEKASLTVSQVEQRAYTVEPWDKNRLLLHLLKTNDLGLSLVFCRTKSTVDALTRFLQKKKIDAHAIHGDLHQGKRNKVMEKLRSGELHVLVASDLAARGIDVDDVTHVINYDLPEDPEIYVHRIGRTARAGRDGHAWSFVTPLQGDLLTEIEKHSGAEVESVRDEAFEPGPVPEDVQIRRQREIERREQRSLDSSRDRLAVPSSKDRENAEKFPGGVAPSAVPAKRMGGRLRSRRR